MACLSSLWELCLGRHAVPPPTSLRRATLFVEDGVEVVWCLCALQKRLVLKIILQMRILSQGKESL